MHWAARGSLGGVASAAAPHPGLLLSLGDSPPVPRLWDFENFSRSLIEGCCWHSAIPHQSPACGTLKYFRGPSPRVAPGTRTLKYFQSGDRAACGSLRQCIGRLAGPWEESRVPRLLTQGCFSHSDSEDFRCPSSRVASGTRTLKYFRCPSSRVAPRTRALKYFRCPSARVACATR